MFIRYSNIQGIYVFMLMVPINIFLAGIHSVDFFGQPNLHMLSVYRA
jgi:hypothetical protein